MAKYCMSIFEEVDDIINQVEAGIKEAYSMGVFRRSDENSLLMMLKGDIRLSQENRELIDTIGVEKWGEYQIGRAIKRGMVANDKCFDKSCCPYYRPTLLSAAWFEGFHKGYDNAG
jgi:hypothetical protein